MRIRDILHTLSILIAGTGISCGQFLINPYSFAAPGGGGGSDPDDIANLAMWLKADSIAVADGTDLSGTTWQDSHTSNKDAALTGSAGQITYQTAEINGHACVRFGTNGGATTALSLTAPYTIILVEKSTSRPSGRLTLNGFSAFWSPNRSSSDMKCHSAGSHKELDWHTVRERKQ